MVPVTNVTDRRLLAGQCSKVCRKEIITLACKSGQLRLCVQEVFCFFTELKKKQQKSDAKSWEMSWLIRYHWSVTTDDGNAAVSSRGVNNERRYHHGYYMYS